MRSLVPIVLNQVVMLVLGVVYVKLVNQYVPPETNGPFGSFFVTLSQIAVLVTHSGLVNHATRYWQRERHQSASYVRFLLIASCAELKWLAPLLFVACCILSLTRGETIWIGFFPLLVISNFALALNSIAAGALNADQSAWRFFFLSFTGTAARTFLTIGIALLGGMTLWMLSLGYALHTLVILGLVFGMFLSTAADAREPLGRDTRKREQWLQELKSYGRPFVLLGAGAWLLQNADRWVVAGFFNEQQAGHFVVAAGLGAIVPTMVVAVLMQMFFPSVFRKSDDARSVGDWKAIAKQCDQITIAFLVLSLVGLTILKLLLPHLVGPLISKDYVPAIDMLIPAGLAVVASQINQFHYLLLQGQHNSAAMVRVMMVVAGVKTFGSIVAAAISWNALMNWLAISVVLAGLIGRFMIRKTALAFAPIAPSPS
jgi:O-antigen/teichoic acid export membrane protein